MSFHPTSSDAPRDAPSRRELLSLLRDVRSYDHGPASVEIVETHISLVALTGNYVYKIKKAVKLDFLDFSTLANRRRFCEREVNLNRRLAGDMYVGVLPIVRQRTGISFNEDAIGEPDESGKSPVVEWAVKMHQLVAGNHMDARLESGTLRSADIDRVVAKLAPFYRHQRESRAVEGRSAGTIKESVIGNLEECEETLAALLNPAAYALLTRFNEHWMDRHVALLDGRSRDGWFVDGHGDLRPEHIYLGPDEVRIYDCIEFDDALRQIDVAADVAFLTMELTFAGRADLARRFAAGIATGIADDDLETMLPLYACYRAVVRGKVIALQAEQSSDESESESKSATARAYFQLASRIALTGKRPLVIVVMGRIASGKSTLTEGLVQALGCPSYSSDLVRKEMHGLRPTERGDEATRQRMYTTAVSRKVYAELIQRGMAAADGNSLIVLDGTFGQRKYREDVKVQADRAVVDCLFVEVRCRDETIRRRLRARDAEDNVVSDAREAQFDNSALVYEAPEKIDETEMVRVNGESPQDDMLRDLLFAVLDRQLGG